MSLLTKLVEVALDVDRVPKRGWNDHHQYAFATEADITSAVRGSLFTRGVVLFTEVERERVEDGVTIVNTLHTFVDSESGEERTLRGLGHGQDKGDKGSGKAITNALKFVLTKNFLIPTGDDPEADDASSTHHTHSAPSRTATPTQSQSHTRASSASGSFTFTFGKHKGSNIGEVPDTYLEWLIKQPENEKYLAQDRERKAVYREELARRKNLENDLPVEGVDGLQEAFDAEEVVPFG